MKSKLLLITIIIVLFLQGVFTNIIHPLTPSYVEQIDAPDYMFGFFFAAMNLGIMLSAPVWGVFADSGKKRMSVVFGFIIYGVFQYLFGFGNIFGPWTLVIFRVFSGIGVGSAFTIFISEIIVISKENKKARNIAFGVASLAIGSAIGQFLGGVLYTNLFFIKLLKTDNIRNIFLIQGILSALLAFILFLVFKPEEVKREKTNNRVNPFKAFKEIKTLDLSLIIFLLSLVFYTMGQVNVDKYLDVYFINDLGYKENVLGTFKMIVGFVGVFTSILIVPLFMKFKKKVRLIAIFQVLSAALVLIIFKGTSFKFITYLYTFYLAYIIVKTINEPLDREYVSAFTTNENMGKLTGIRQSFYSLGTVIGPVLGAFLYDYNRLLVFYVSAIFFIVAFILIVVSNFVKNENSGEAITSSV